ncbi:endolytic transglycosylase MltG [Atopobacter sp. AH10]|uniref:endolytic transglycosylase MltG n=1 Tax=Atopobacter sp. AH10 TaxID=2315861 RepID=UPI000EF1C2CA|nr:endolytic transglycosylase MltG [Atopobacter sp. AH10]RLK62991.1 endolytic transglycosylase MltG [Atopobacter sp. AH10]
MKRPLKTPAEKKMEEKRKQQNRERDLAGKISRSILRVLLLLALILGFAGYRYVSNALQPLSSSSAKKVEVEIPLGSSNRQIAQILEDKKIIRNAKIFNLYMKVQNVADLQAGYYDFSPSMTAKQVIKQLEKQGKDSAEKQKKVLVREGENIEQIAKAIDQTGVYKKEDFIHLMQDDNFLSDLAKEYPDLLSDSLKSKDSRYKLEGYLFPATYNVLAGEDLKTLVKKMIAKTDQVMSKYKEQIEEDELNLHQIMTLASLVEKEGVNLEDRKMIAGVFRNRLARDMMLQSDISVLYALNKHKEFVTLKDTKVDSPYNLYQHTGLGPGPFNSPSEAAIQATLNYIKNDNLYFLANLKTGKVYYSKTYEEHQKLVEEHINKPKDGQ